VAALILVLVTVSVDFEVVMRYVFNSPTAWVFDFSEYAIVFILFLSTAWVLSEEGHVKIDLLVKTFSPKTQRVVNIVTSIVGAVACAIFFGYALWVIFDIFQAGDLLWRATIVPKGPIWMIMPIGSFLLTLQFARRAWFYAREREVLGKEAL
jgi:TRAP-type C4-dicarboxylate transport system permease small subunit